MNLFLAVIVLVTLSVQVIAVDQSHCRFIQCEHKECPNPIPPGPGECCSKCPPINTPDCSAVSCARPDCDNPITLPGQCCPVCLFTISPPPLNCEEIQCDIPLCPNPIPPRPGQCCPTCPPIHPPDCSRVRCARPNCDNYIKPPGQCCLVCPPKTPPNCRTVQCESLSCPNPLPPAPGQCCKRCLEDCRVILCARPNCDNPITPPGRCCPVCPPTPPLNCEKIQCDVPICSVPLVPPGPGQCCPSCPEPPHSKCDEVQCERPICANPTPPAPGKCCPTCPPIILNGTSSVPLSSPIDCPPGVPVTACLVNPCDFTTCSNFPTARCVFDNCGGCHARFFVGRKEVTNRCEKSPSCSVKGQVFQECRTCPATCSTPDLVCAAVCLPGCGCPSNQVIDEKNNRCVERSQCPGPNVQSCPIKGQVFLRCGSCPVTCSSPNIVCRRLCSPGCGCPGNQVIDEKNKRCVERSQCPGVPSSCPIQGQVFQRCRSCPATCDNPNLICIAVCQPGCGCPFGQVIDEINRKCVPQNRCPSTDKCTLPREPGPCLAYIPRYFYNSVTKRCERFIYGGCQGNDNNFMTLNECQKECSIVTPDKCTLPREPGPCRAYFPRYFYNSVTKRCERFIYGGCRGNDNNFGSFEECQNECEEGHGSSGVCSLPRDPGPCDAAITRYFFNGKSCVRFVYGGCRGNANNFKSIRECRTRCQEGQTTTDKCTLPRDPGPCRGAFPRYFYDANTRTCKSFIYGGCRGNTNNFKTFQECRQECHKETSLDRVCHLPRDPGPCRAAFLRFFYNSFSKKCERFTYGGCAGNDNNFKTREECQRRCNVQVSVPYRPPVCSEEYCSGGRDRICTLPLDTPGTIIRRSHCDVTVCKACYHSYYPLPHPRLHRRCPQIIPLFGGSNSSCGQPKLLRRWAYCIFKAYKRTSTYKKHEGSFRCWRPPFPYIG